MKFGINWDYRCPFARNMHEHLITALKDGADWEVCFIPFSLSQVHIEEDAPSVWDDPSKYNELLAVASGMVVNEHFADRFYDFHLAMFRARHDEARDIASWDVLADILTEHNIDSVFVKKQIDEGTVLEDFRTKHMDSVERLKVFGVPTFFIGETATFVRVMTRPNGSPARSRELLEHLLASFSSFPEFNEIKQTTISR